MNNKNTLESISAWFNTATPTPSPADVTTQIGAMLEEMAEVISALDCDCIAKKVNALSQSFYALNNEQSAEYLPRISNVALLDGLADVNVTAVGVAEFLGYDYHGALDEVNRSNYSKFENGQAVRDEFGKIAKGKDYFNADLERFV
ncbi:nucleoside triphosphate pyrophosphohydrolase family protein [Moraxella bovoculi]|uniref:nucleoside triphosphate pyrophosphohydrolase family protein n=1 Tax=Moraxella bovoculi TaxID=386891 RepID=UPI003F4FB565